MHSLWMNVWKMLRPPCVWERRRACCDRPVRRRQPARPARSAKHRLAEVWAAATLASLADEDLPAQHRAWVKLTRPLALVEDTVLLAAPNDFAKEILETRLRPVIATALSQQLGREVRVAVTVDSTLPDDTAGEPGEDSAHEPVADAPAT